jgi:hypothetical protein
MRRRPKLLPWRNLISVLTNASGSWCRSGTNLPRGRKKSTDRRRALELLASCRDGCAELRTPAAIGQGGDRGDVRLTT